MADLLNVLVHMRNKAVLVNGTVYQIDSNGIAKDVSDTDAEKLLRNRAWLRNDPEALREQEERRKALRDQFKQGGIQLITKQGDLIDPKAINELEDEKEATQAGAPDTQVVATSEDTPPPDPAGSTDMEGLDIEDQQAMDEWPDPHMGMKKPFLQHMARAYGLVFTPQTKKQELVEMITRAMYDET